MIEYDLIMQKKPPELHIVDGTKPKQGEIPALIPSGLKKRIPQAEWLDNPAAWNRAKFIEETSNFLYEVYGIGSDQDKHVLSMLADQIETYVLCVEGLRQDALVSTFNHGATQGPNPLVAIRNKTTTLIIQLMNELGLTPKSRLAKTKSADDSPLGKLMKGPKG